MNFKSTDNVNFHFGLVYSKSLFKALNPKRTLAQVSLSLE